MKNRRFTGNLILFMKIFLKQLSILVAILVLLLVVFEFVINELSIDGVFSVYYSLPILLFAVFTQYFIKENRFNLITIIFYLAILFLTLVSIIHILTFDRGFGFESSSIPVTHIISVVLNILLMIITILQFSKHTRNNKSTI